MNSMRRLLLLCIVSASVFLWLPAGEQTGAQTKSFEVGKGGLLQVTVASGNIILSPWEKSEVVIRAQGIAEENLSRLQMTKSGNTVRVDYRPRRNSSDDDLEFDISLPSQFNVELRTSGGNIDLRGSISGTLHGSTAGGNITLADVGGRTEMNTSGGHIRTGKIQGEARLTTSGGNIEVQAASGEVTVTTSGGNIDVGNVGKTLAATTAGGNIRIGDVGGSATASTAGGHVVVGKVSGNVSLETAGGNIELGGGNGIIKANTAGGDIRLYNISGSVSAVTAGGNVFAELIPSGSGTSKLVTAGGDVRLYLPESSKATIDAFIELSGRGSQRSRYDVRSDFKPEKYDKSEDEIRATFKLNGGGEIITLETVNGNIEVRKLTRK